MTKRTSKIQRTESLLVEVLTEELPPNSLRRLAVAFANAVHDYLKDKDFVEGESGFEEFATPRRLAVRVPHVRARQPEQLVSRKGPYVQIGIDASGKPTQALLGFARSCGVAAEELERHRDEKGEYFLYRASRKGEQLAKLLPEIINDALKRLPIAKLMRWGAGDSQFVRPVHSLLILLGRNPIRLPERVLGVQGGSRRTAGHRFLGKRDVAIPSADEYERILEKSGRVIASIGERRERILTGLESRAHGATLLCEDRLIDEITALVEFPVVYKGAFSPDFLEVPQESLILSMQQHQRYVPLADANGKLLPRFLIVSNIQTDNPIKIIRGNERVLRARLSDAKFFYDQDRRERLETRVLHLEKVVYHSKLGNQFERVKRLQSLSEKIAHELKADAGVVKRAAWLAKADLLTGMVGEFPELQGVMGRYYALHDGEPREVADAIEAHYRPRFAGDKLPEGSVACAVALADKLHTLAGLFGVGEQPTGEKDPFGLRRAALGVIRIIVERDLPLDLFKVVNAAFGVFDHKIGDAHTDLHAFFLDRMRSYFQERSYTANEVEAVLSLNPIQINLIPKQLKAVRAFSALPEAASLAAANKRIANILRQAEKKGESFINADVSGLKEPAEISLFEALQTASRSAKPLFDSGDFAGYLKTFASLKNPVDSFFDAVMVMVDDKKLRENRLALLTDMRKAMNRFADISKLAA